ncbi:MAG: GTPase HflX [Planctomycetes bacterium]|nr:GTPase HflX [Planctomycetota bacterium]
MENKRNTEKVHQESALLVNVALPHSEIEPVDSLAELAALAEAAHAVVVDRVVQKRRTPHPAHYVGHGKAEEIGLRAEHFGAKTIIFDNDLSPAQIRELEDITGCKVIDRSELILDIFAHRARTHEARLQVELAQLQYTYPRLTRMWGHLDTLTAAASGGAGAVGGIGTRGPGEKQLEIDRRLVNKRLTQLREQIKQIDKRKQRQVKSRSDHFTVSLVGYTNAGKSTLLNLLTDANTYVEDKLFATLDTKTSRWNLSRDINVLLSDTVGFIRNLPHHLIASFRATLEEAIHADLLLHVVDASHPQADRQLQDVHKVLKEIGCENKDVLLVLNKIDERPNSMIDTMQTLYPDAAAISARKGLGIDILIDAVMARVKGDNLRLRVICSQSEGHIPSFLRAHGSIISEEYSDSIITLEVTLGRRQLTNLQRLKPQKFEILNALDVDWS